MDHLILLEYILFWCVQQQSLDRWLNSEAAQEEQELWGASVKFVKCPILEPCENGDVDYNYRHSVIPGCESLFVTFCWNVKDLHREEWCLRASYLLITVWLDHFSRNPR